MGICVLIDPGISSGWINVNTGDAAVGAEVSIQTFGAVGVGMIVLSESLICSEHLFSIVDLFFVYIAPIHDGGLASG